MHFLVVAQQTLLNIKSSKIKTKTKEIHLVNYYCPNNINLDLLNISIVRTNFIIVGYFNSHSQSWGYHHIDARGERIKEWQDDNNLILINKPEDSPTPSTLDVGGPQAHSILLYVLKTYIVSQRG